MNIFVSILLLCVGIGLVIVGGNIFVDASINLGKKLRIPAIIVGATFVSVATTLPELFVSTFSATTSAGLAVGNAIGSVICNTALVCGLSIAIVPAVIKEKTSIVKYIILILAISLLFFFGSNFNIGLWESVVMLVLFVVFMASNIFDAKKQMKYESIYEKENSQEKANEEQEQKNEEQNTKANKQNLSAYAKLKQKFAENVWLIVLSFVLGAGILVVGAEAMVKGATNICSLLGISDALIGLTVVAIGTSLPELVTTITSIKKKTAALGYGNIIGANIMNLTLIMGLCGVINGNKGLSITKSVFFIDFVVAMLCSVVFILPLMLKSKTYRLQGIFMLMIYVAYIALSIVFEILHIAI